MHRPDASPSPWPYPPMERVSSSTRRKRSMKPVWTDDGVYGKAIADLQINQVAEAEGSGVGRHAAASVSEHHLPPAGSQVGNA